MSGLPGLLKAGGQTGAKDESRGAKNLDWFCGGELPCGSDSRAKCEAGGNRFRLYRLLTRGIAIRALHMFMATPSHLHLNEIASF